MYGEGTVTHRTHKKWFVTFCARDFLLGNAPQSGRSTEIDNTLAGVAQWIECQPANQRVADLIPSLGHMPELWARSPVWGV